ncbi:MAG: hypothetical protein HEP71_32115 [Roseivirga sp.]|nr:hypothetical protein [Roseivirga sp.]
MFLHKSRHIFILIGVITCLSIDAQTSQYRFEHLDITDGLSQNTVNDIFQDSEGYIWIATQDGLNRYDGYEIKQYLPNRMDSTSISDNFLWNITEDEQGNIWICSRNGVNRLNRQSGTFTKFYTGQSQSPTSLAHLDNRAYVLLGNKVHIIDHEEELPLLDSVKNHETLITDLETTSPFSIKSTDHDLLFFGKAGVLIVSGDSSEMTPFTLAPGSFVTSDNQVVRWTEQKYLIGTSVGLFLFDQTKREITPFLEHLTSDNIHAINFGPRGHLWLSTNNGLQIINLEEAQFVDFNPVGESADILSSEVIFSIFKGSNDMLWVGTSNNGLFLYDQEKDRFRFLDTSSGLSSSMVWSMAQVDENEYWVATENGVDRITLKAGVSFSGSDFAPEAMKSVKPLMHKSIKGKRVNMIYLDESGNRWLGVHGKGLHIFDSGNRLIRKLVFNKGDAISNQITSVVRFENRYWVTTFKGIYRVSDNLRVEDRWLPEELNTQYFFKGYVDSHNKLWLGSNSGFFRYNPDNQKLTHFEYKQNENNSPGFYFVNDFQEAPGDKIWLATFGGGLDLFDAKKPGYQHFTQRNGLANNVVASLQMDKNHRLWMGTNRGISLFDPADSVFVNFNREDGLVFNETAINSSYQNEQGELLFGTAGGLIIFHPDSIEKNIPAKAPRFTGFKINYEDTGATIQNGETIDLYPRDKVVSLEFATLAYRNADRLLYEFKIEGIDDQWIRTDANNRRATYSTLPFGTNILQVRTLNTHGSISPVSRVLLVVHPPFYLSWWFISSVIVLILLLTISIIRAYYHNRLRSRLKDIEVKQQVQNERERISRDLHDNVGSHIAHIISSLDNISYQHREQAAVTDKLSDLGDFTRSTLRFLRESIWVINKNEIPLSEFIEKAEDHGNKICENTNIAFTLVQKGENVILNPTLTMNLFRIFQEGLINVIKHAQASKIQVRIINLGGQLQMTIRDNGIGFDGDEKKGHYGLSNIKERVLEMHGSFQLSSSEKGTLLDLTVPIIKSTSYA